MKIPKKRNGLETLKIINKKWQQSGGSQYNMRWKPNRNKGFRTNKRQNKDKDSKFGFTSARSDSTDDSQPQTLSHLSSFQDKDTVTRRKDKRDDTGEAAASTRDFQRKEQEMRQTRYNTKRGQDTNKN